MTEQISETARRSARELRAVVGRLRRRVREVAGNDQLTPSQTSVLGRLHKGGPASASDLAALERVRPQSIAATVGVLEERRLVERRPDPGDGRRQLILLTPTGRDFVEDRRQSGEEWLARVLQDRFTEAERRTVLEALTLLERVTEE